MLTSQSEVKKHFGLNSETSAINSSKSSCLHLGYATNVMTDYGHSSAVMSDFDLRVLSLIFRAGGVAAGVAAGSPVSKLWPKVHLRIVDFYFILTGV